MSIIPIAAQLIRQAAVDENYAMDLDLAVRADERAFDGLVHADLDSDELYWLKPSEWLWFARWRQSQGGRLEPLILELLGSVDASRSWRFELRSLVMRDPATERQASAGFADASDETRPGLDWLQLQAQVFSDPTELARDALQIATKPAWFTLRVLTAADARGSSEIRGLLRALAEQREISPEITSRWSWDGRL